ncbi:hypothetical protein [Cerasicoccus fimbriatus]|uniref:hypothetical protein n=1 Tax=Cerasicoccus fimbriatus TaxID=3014554 RepID=UPI0022B4A351|nr:hypothetical protein [Cerasicoccus sp. TK19100]
MKKSSAATHFEVLLPEGQKWFTTREVADMLGRTPQFVRDCYESGRLPGHRFTSYVKGRTRYTYQFHRDTMLLFLLETANYEPEDFADRLVALLTNRSTAESQAIFRKAGVLVAPKTQPDSGRGGRLRATGTC